MKRKFNILVALMAIFLLFSFPISTLAATSGRPQYLSLALSKDRNDRYTSFAFTWKNPDEIKQAVLDGKTVVYEIDVREGIQSWQSESKEMTYRQNLSPKDLDMTEVVVEGDRGFKLNKVDVFNKMYTFRVRYVMDGQAGPFSNEVRIGTKPNFNNNSLWSNDELALASENGFISPAIQNNMRQDMTREEFVDLIIRVYEKLQNMHLIAGKSPYTDTENPAVIKATQLGLVKGVGQNRFSPKSSITRQEMAVIFTRLLNSLEYKLPAADGSNPFVDHQEIAPWALSEVYQMQKLGLIEGDQNHRFMPKSKTTREQGVVLGQRVYTLLED